MITIKMCHQVLQCELGLIEKLVQEDDANETCLGHTLSVYCAQISRPITASFSQMIHVTTEQHRLLNSCMSF